MLGGVGLLRLAFVAGFLPSFSLLFPLLMTMRAVLVRLWCHLMESRIIVVAVALGPAQAEKIVVAAAAVDAFDLKEEEAEYLPDCY